MPIGQENIVDMGKPEGDGERKTPPKPSPAATDRADRDLKTRLEEIFRRIADAAEARGDDELADIIREDMKVMATGLVSLTRPLRALRGPLMLLLAIVEPFMAFSRVTRVMLGRFMDRRAERAQTGEEVTQ